MVFIRIQRKSLKRMHAKVYDRTEEPVVFDLWVKPQTNGFHEFILLFSILLQIDRLQLTAVCCNGREVVKALFSLSQITKKSL